ncbi:uncharacterized protein [Littorina saxatilis]|uniref:uncharacterized protein isoform X2 n=1 Tax=Littorina saxatilis TaxID=31220 RepID=UPI0038B512E0
MVGLWRYCHDEPKYDCEDFDTMWKVDAWLEASRAFAIMGFLALVLCAVSTLLVCFVSHVKVFYSIAPVSSLLASFFIFIEFSVFSGEVERRKNSIGQEFEYHYCFALTVIAFILSLIATLLFLCGSLRGPPEAKYEVRERQRRDSKQSF